MGRDEKGHAFTGELEKQIPQFAAGDRINASRWLIEKQHGRPVHKRASHCQTLTPTAGKLRGASADVRLKMRCCDHFVAPLIQFATAQAIKFSGEDEVLIHGQLVIERKFLRHVADHFFDRLGISHNIMAPDARRALSRLENSAQHPDHGCFPGTIRPEKPEDRSFSDRE